MGINPTTEKISISETIQRIHVHYPATSAADITACLTEHAEHVIGDFAIVLDSDCDGSDLQQLWEALTVLVVGDADDPEFEADEFLAAE